MNFLIINGPNMNLLGRREPDIYGEKTYLQLIEFIINVCAEEEIEPEFFQSNHEGAIIDEIQDAYGVFDGIIINPAGYTHTSVAIADAIRAVGIPTAEVHLSDVDSREPYRRVSYVKPACVFTISGQGFEGYAQAVRKLKAYVNAHK